MPDRFPGYDVLAKRNTPSWNEPTRREPRFFTEQEYATVTALADRITPQPKDRPPIPVASLIDERLRLDQQDGFRAPTMPRHQEAWHLGLLALDAEARTAFGKAFRDLTAPRQDDLITRLQIGEMHDPASEGMAPKTFFEQRVLRDIDFAYWSHPTAWNEIGWGGPASPRGYVRMGYDTRDPWEAAEVKDGDVAGAIRKNRHVG